MSSRSDSGSGAETPSGRNDTDVHAVSARAHADSGLAKPVIAPGECLGRYTVRALVGAGAMGEVYSAVDPELDRVVALKVLRTDISGESPAARLRFQREAQAMARLNHPNVVSVYDVGTLAERVFVAMELVLGPTLAVWLVESPRGWREVVRVFVQAGRGLEAAHAAGLVHRDFKPSNVIVGERVRVADFGLARASFDDAPEQAAAPTALDSVVTATGQVLGTPAYIAPEQLGGAPASPLGDQYSFAVALHEALTGVRPGGGAPLRAMPGWLRAVVERGLRQRPEDRYPSMSQLLDDLDRDPDRARRPWLVAATLAVLVAAGLVAQRQLSTSRCGDSRARLAGVWDDERRNAVGAAFAATKLPYADDAWSRVSADLDGYAADWAAMHDESCRATRVEGRQSDSLMDLRMACLERRRAVLGTLTALWARGMDAKSLEAATDAAGRLAPLAECADARALTEREPPPADTGLAAQAVAARAHIDAAQALLLAGHHADAKKEAIAARAEADATGWAPVKAEATLSEGAVLDAIGDAHATSFLIDAARLGGDAHDDTLAARALVRLVGRIVASDARSGLLAADIAEGVIARAGGDALLRIDLLRHRGTALAAQGQYSAALSLISTAHAWSTALRGAGDRETVGSASQLVRLASNHGDFAAAQRMGEEAVAATSAVLGPEHPRVAYLINAVAAAAQAAGDLETAAGDWRRAATIMEMVNPDSDRTAEYLLYLGTVEIELGNLDEAQALIGRSLDKRERLFGPEHPEVAMTLNNLAAVLRKQGRIDQASAVLERSLDITDRISGPGNPLMAYPLSSIGEVLEAKGDEAGALAVYERALEIREKAFGVDQRLTLESKRNVVTALARLGRCGEARPLLAAVIPILEKVDGPHHPDLALTLAARARCDLAEGRGAAALEGVDRALAILEKAKQGRVVCGAERWLQARALAALGRRTEAVTAARQAERELGADDDGKRDRVAAVDWLASAAGRPPRR